MTMKACAEQQTVPDISDQIARIDRFLDERAHRLRTSRGVPAWSQGGFVALMCAGAGLFAAGATFMTLIR